jgi:hypothetical protein
MEIAMSISQATQAETQLIAAYTDQLMAHEKPNPGQVGDARQNPHMRGVEKQTGADLQTVEEAVKFFKSTRTQKTDDTFEIVGLKDQPRADRKAGEDKRAGSKIQGWHETVVKRAGQDLEKLGFDVQQIKVGPGGDTFSGTVQVGEGAAARAVPFELTMTGGGTRTLFGGAEQMAALLNDPSTSGVTSCVYDTANSSFEYKLPAGTIRLNGEATPEEFKSGLTAYGALQNHTDGATGAQATGTFAVKDGQVEAECLNAMGDDGAKAWVPLGDLSGMNAPQIQDAFSRAVVGLNDPRPATQILAETKAHLKDPAYPIEEKVYDCLAVAGLQGSEGVTDAGIIDVLMTALNADGKTEEGRQLNEAAINALGELQDSPRATEILSRIATKTPSEDYYMTAVQSLAQIAASSGDDNKAQTLAALQDIQKSAQAGKLAFLKGAEASVKEAAVAHVKEMIAGLQPADPEAVAEDSPR